MLTLLSDLEELEDALDSIVFEDEPSIFTEEYAIELIETAFIIIDEYMEQNPTAVSEPDFEDILLEEIVEIFYAQMEDHILELNGDYIEDDLNEIIEYAVRVFISTFHPERSYNSNICDDFHDIKGVAQDKSTAEDKSTIEDKSTADDKSAIEDKINILRAIPQPTQRTDEWYSFRYNLITASNAYKAFESQSTVNQLIYEKCKPLVKQGTDEEGVQMVNTNSPLHWGQKYEPLSVMVYEDKYKTTVEDFGCIKHNKYAFLGASPDGINVDHKSARYGRMLEIKNVVNREINGIPKKEYWIQTQLQMEVCNLDECDFLETKFVEYPSHQAYLHDTAEDEDRLDLSKDKKQKGIIIQFYAKDGKPFYAYKPLNIIDSNSVSEWEETIISKYQDAPYNYTFIKYIYWKLEIISCVLVCRNKEWFKNNIGQLEKVWKIIEDERVTGYEHRGPSRKQKADTSRPYVSQLNESSNGCLLKFTKIIKVDTEVYT